ncbi:ATP-grasp domain-containing protein [Roseibium aestuarii]|uniref:RimK family alpha-L-glutamate ligase n=1 Tax=Roseibium aestuarii TaxID=2600299 RepID=A0ABW4JVP7_9HYPH|nr:ATP-dependent carboxylate-amine ligase [Roseibium aestuarii]
MRDQPLSLVARLLSGFCARHGLRLHLVSGLGQAGIIEGPTGRRHAFVGTRFDLNPQGACELARDKAYAAEFLSDAGLPVPAHHLVLATAYRQHLSRTRPEYQSTLWQGFDEARAFARGIGFPVYVKPNTGSGGQDVECIGSETALTLALARLSEHHRTLMVQKAVEGHDLRLLCLDERILCALIRRPATVTGDGESSLATLIRLHAVEDADRADMERHLSAAGLRPDHVPLAGELVPVLPMANLSRGGHASFRPLDQIAIPLQEAALSAGRVLGLRYFAVDMIAADPGDPQAAFHLLEVNGAPGLAELHRQDETAAAMVKEIYESVFTAILRDLGSP